MVGTDTYNYSDNVKGLLLPRHGKRLENEDFRSAKDDSTGISGRIMRVKERILAVKEKDKLAAIVEENRNQDISAESQKKGATIAGALLKYIVT